MLISNKRRLHHPHLLSKLHPCSSFLFLGNLSIKKILDYKVNQNTRINYNFSGPVMSDLSPFWEGSENKGLGKLLV